MSTISYKKGNTLQLFYHDGTTWKPFSYSTSHSLSRSMDSNSISSKDHGIWPDMEVTGASWTLSLEAYWTKDNADIINGMMDKAEPFTFCFAQIAQADDWADGIQPVTDKTTQTAWTPGNVWVRYGNGLVTSSETSAPNLETATISLEITGSGALTDTAPTNIKSYTTD